MRNSCAFMRSNIAEDLYIVLQGISEGEKHVDDLR